MRPDPITNIHATGMPGGPPTLTGPAGLVPPRLGEARQLYLAGDLTAALDLLDAICDDPRPGKPLREVALLKCWCLIDLKRHTDCSDWLAEARDRRLLNRGDIGAQVIALNLRLFHEEYAAVQAEAERLLADPDTPVDVDHAELRLLLGAALRWQGRLQESVTHLEYACSAFTVTGETGRQAVASNFLGWTHLSMGHLGESARWFEKSLQINTGLGANLRMAQNYQNLAIVCYKQGHYDRAVELLTLELELTAAHPDMTCRARIALGNTLRLKGDYLNARSSLMVAYSLAVEEKLAREETLALEFLGDVLRDEGQPGEARRYYQRGMKIALELAPRGDLVMELLRREGECLGLEGRHEEAWHILNDALAMCREVGDRFETAVTLRCLGVTAANLGRWQTARENLRDALSGLRALSARQEAMLAGHHLAEVLIRQIDTGNAGSKLGGLLEEAWQQVIAAQQINQELGIPLLARELQDMVETLARRRLANEIPAPTPRVFSVKRAPTTRIIAVSSAMQQVLRVADGFARYDTPVMITGENGTGKELLARRIHENSPRGAKPLVRVACTASGVDTLDRELFGRGGAGPDGPAFTPGLVAQAEGGTLLLTGIGDLPRLLQGRLLRLIQDHTYRPLDEGRDRPANVRVIVTTDVDLAPLVEQGRFRPDLLFRLRLMNVRVPSLRERSEEVAPLLDHFLTRLEGSTLTARALFDFQALEGMAMYHWPGNVAELELIAQKAWLNRDLGRPALLRRIETASGSRLEFQEEYPLADPEAQRSPPSGHPSGMTLGSLNALIARAGGNKAQVARNLGIARMTLYRWLSQLESEA